MKIARFRTGRRIAYGVVKGEEVIEIRGGIYAKFRMTDIKYRLSDVKLLPPPESAPQKYLMDFGIVIPQANHQAMWSLSDAVILLCFFIPTVY